MAHFESPPIRMPDILCREKPSIIELAQEYAIHGKVNPKIWESMKKNGQCMDSKNKAWDADVQWVGKVIMGHQGLQQPAGVGADKAHVFYTFTPPQSPMSYISTKQNGK